MNELSGTPSAGRTQKRLRRELPVAPTPSDISALEFSTELRGYRRDVVDGLLRELADVVAGRRGGSPSGSLLPENPTAQDLLELQLPSQLRGYCQLEVDEALDTIVSHLKQVGQFPDGAGSTRHVPGAAAPLPSAIRTDPAAGRAGQDPQ